MSQEWGKKIDAYFKPFYQIKPAPKYLRQNGITRLWAARLFNPEVYGVRYRIDTRKDRGETILLEPVSAYLKIPQLLVYYIPDIDLGICVSIPLQIEDNYHGICISLEKLKPYTLCEFSLAPSSLSPPPPP